MLALFHDFCVWLRRRLGVGTYQLRDSEIISGRGQGQDERISIPSIKEWQVRAEMGFDVIAIGLEDGRMVNCIDRDNDLIGILRAVAPSRERPWTFA